MVDISRMQGLVYDNGSCFSGDDSPRAVFPTLVGVPKYLPIMVGMGAKDSFVGDEAQAKRGILKLRRPIKNGIIWNFNDMLKVFHQSPYNELCCAPEEHPTLLMETVLTPIEQRKKVMSIQFETFNIPAGYMTLHPLMNVFATGKTTGCFVECGEGVTQCICVFEGYCLYSSARKLNLGGFDITMALANEMNKTNKVNEKMVYKRKKLFFEEENEVEIARDIKENLCFVSLNYEKDLKEKKEEVMKYYLCDGGEVNVGVGRFRSTEILFNPSLFGLEMDGIHEMVKKSIEKCDRRIWKDLYSNINVSGGSTMFEGFVKRFGNEVQSKTKEKVGVSALPERKFTPWIGGSKLTVMSSFNDVWITKDEYNDCGSSIFYKKSKLM